MRTFTTLLLSLTLATILTGTAHGQSFDGPVEQPATAGEDQKPLVDPPEYGGVVTNQALTSLGHYFHSRFTEGWSALEDAQAYVLAVRERSSPRVGTEILIIHNDQVMYRSSLPRNTTQIVTLALSAVETVHTRLIEMGLQTLLFDDPDLARLAY